MHTPPLPSPTKLVRRRKVFYFSGFDPKGPAHYHALYRYEATKQSQVSGVSLEIGERRKTSQGDAVWNITSQTSEGVVNTHYEILRWDDIVRKHWPTNHLTLLWAIVLTSVFNFRHGALWQMLQLSWPPVVALLSPFLLLCFLVIGMPLMVFMIFSEISRYWGGWPAAIAAGGFFITSIQVSRLIEKKYSMFWLMRSYAFTAQQAQGNTPDLDSRLNKHAKTLLNAVRNATEDEVLIVGHSSGATMAVSVLARAIREDCLLGKRGPAVSLLTLGQCIPLLGCLPQAQNFREDLAMLAKTASIDWVDFSAPSDGCCFALVNPVAACGINMIESHDNRPKLLSPKFAEIFHPTEYAAICRNKFRVHFQYLMAGSKIGIYDYFAITSGNETLSARFREYSTVEDYSVFKIFNVKPKTRKFNRS